jgi:hypothetical protein
VELEEKNQECGIIIENESAQIFSGFSRVALIKYFG